MQKMSEQTFELDTEPFAGKNGVKPQSVRARYCRTGSYFGVVPRKLRNGRLKWPDVQVEASDAGEAA
jgi:hypothetical protein